MGFVRPKHVMHLPGELTLTRADILDEDDPIVKGREAAFEPIEVGVARLAGRTAQAGQVEQATKAPGEKRFAKRAAAKKAAPPRPAG